jgi:predicted nucleic acid-binding protein
MILVDTSIWIDHLRIGDECLVTLLNENKVLLHPFIIGELACGNLSNRTEVLRLLKDLPQAAIATDSEVLFFIERHRLMGRGIGYIDAHVLAFASLAEQTHLWTRDKRLLAVSAALSLAYETS